MASFATCFISYTHVHYSLSSLSQSMYYLLLLFLSIFLLSLSLLLFSLFRRLKKTEESHSPTADETSLSTLNLSPPKIADRTRQTHQTNSTQLPYSLLVELLPSKSPKWATLFSSARAFDNRVVDGSGLSDSSMDGDGLKEDGEIKRMKKRTKKKKQNLSDSENLQLENGGGRRSLETEDWGVKNQEELVCLYPFTSSSSATQRKIKQQYDELVRSHESKGLTLAQVGRFVNCLVDARIELQQKSEIIQRKFTITKALLLKADRSSFDRLRQQICKLELEQKRLEEDAFVYNWLQHQLKLSPAYKKMLEIGASMELKAKSGELTETPEADSPDISFEEFLAQEKKDSFWQKHGKPRSCSS